MSFGILLALVAAPSFVTVTAWATLSAVRLLRPMQTVRSSVRRVPVRAVSVPARPVVVVAGDGGEYLMGGRRDRWREFHHARYDYRDGRSTGFPEAWWENAIMRRS